VAEEAAHLMVKNERKGKEIDMVSQ
jgi:hypothetical protein